MSHFLTLVIGDEPEKLTDEKDKDAWIEEVKQLLASLPPDTLLTMYDCHI